MKISRQKPDRPSSACPFSGFERILVTGGGGFVGRRLVDRLHAVCGQTVQISAPIRYEDESGRLCMDLERPDSVQAALQAVRPDLIVHLAGQSSVGAGASSEGAAATWRSNVSGALNLGEAIASITPSAIVLFSSSVEVYGTAFRAGRVDENTLPQPLSVYARSKLAAEQILSDIMPLSSKLIIARPGNHSGSGQDRRFVLPSFASQIHRNEIRVGNLEAERDFLHVDDVIDAYLSIILASGRLRNREVFNVASGQPISIGALLERMMRQGGSNSVVLTDPDRLRPSDIPKTEISADYITATTGWRPIRSIDEMLIEILSDA